MRIELQSTADGSPTLFLPDIDEHYHSVKGALSESQHVYIDLCWKEWVVGNVGKEIKVFEVGFGTGLNAALTAINAVDNKVPTIYYSIELHPIDHAISEELEKAFTKELAKELYLVNRAEWNKEVEINPYFTLIKIQGDFLKMEFPRGLNAIYFDAFAPEKQPEMWNPEVIQRLYDNIVSGGILTTYCAKGQIRRMLAGIGFVPERLSGPPGGKREVLRCRKK
ncbi:MAG: tRNA (5-methylaminomethyl-2-thiouridine)(34)-methyltransferase MnmD [Bacteroidales bacterium]|nr:tRNA (5-methylaminomethyl-2-thiouridine)(34)-methyltransferase MnmD [Bacteroidales bacterium]